MSEEIIKFIEWIGDHDIYKYAGVDKWHWQGKGIFSLQELYELYLTKNKS